MNAATGICEITENTYTCPVPPGNTVTATNCPANVFCLAGNCFNTSYTNDADFARSMSLMEAAREAAPDLAGNTGEAIAEATASVAARAGATTEAEPLSRAEAKEEIFFQRRAGIFFSIYYVMTGIHAIHILIGIIAIGFLTVFSMKGRYSSVWYTPVENVGLYWHIVDIIWIFVFPLMYLI